MKKIMKKSISMVMVLAMLISLLGGLSVSAAGTKRVYLLNEGFEGTPSYTSAATKGVSIVDGAAEGILSADGKTYGKYLHLKETDGDLNFYFEKGKKVTFEFDMYNYNETNATNNNLALYLNDSDVNLISGAGVSLHRLYVYGIKADGSNGAWMYDKDQSARKWHHIKIVADGETSTWQAWVNGVQASAAGNSTFPTRRTVTGFDWVRIVASANANRLIDNIKVMTEKELGATTEVVLNEGFESDANYTTTATTGVSVIDGLAEGVLSADGTTYGKYLKATATDGDINLSFKRGKKVTVEFDMFNYNESNGTANNVDIYINDSRKSGAEALTYGAGIRLHRIYQRGIGTAGEDTWMFDKAQEAQKWHKVKVVANADTDSYEAWINGTQVASSGNTSFPTRRGDVSAFDTIRIASSANVNRLFDNFKVTVEEDNNYLKKENFEAEPYEFDTKATTGVAVGNDGAFNLSTGNAGSYLQIKNNDADVDLKFDAAKKVAIEFDFYNPLEMSVGNIITMYINDSSIAGEAAMTYGAPLIIEEDRIRGMEGSTYYEMCTLSETKVWNHIKVLANAETDTFDVWVNDSYAGNYAFRRGAMNSIDWIRIAKSSQTLLIDNITVADIVDSALTDIKYYSAANTEMAPNAVSKVLKTIKVYGQTDSSVDITSEGIYNAITITDEYGNNVAYTYALDVADDSIALKLNDNVYAGVTYTVSVNGLKDTSGTVLPAFTKTFTVTGAKEDNKGVAEVKITDANGSMYIEDGDTVKAKADVLSWGDMASYKLLLAYYDAEGKLVNVEISDAKAAQTGIKTPAEFNGTQVVDGTIASVKAFIWADENTIAPYGTADVTNTNDKGFNNGDTLTVAMIGDSITAGCNYEKYIEHYYNMKYPERDIVFVNKGISRGNANKVVARFDWDILNNEYTKKPDVATMMIGMNDINHSVYPDGDTEKYLNWCYENIEAVITLCKANDIELTLITPSLYDDDAVADGLGTAIEGVNAGLGKVAEKMKEFAVTYNLEVIDMWTATNEINDAVRANASVAGKLLSDDRIHLNDLGDVAFAYSFIKQQIGDDAKIMVDVDSEGNVTLNNARVSGLEKTADGVSFTYSPKGLPMAVTDKYIELENYGYDITGEINSEIIKVAGLEDGDYTLKIDDAVIGEYSAAKLARGINIAANELYAGQIKAVELFANTEQKRFYEHRTRCSAYCDELMIANNIEYTDDEVAYKWLSEKLDDSAFASHKDFISITLRDVWGKKAQVWENLNNYAKAAETTPYAYTYTVTITKN